MKKPKMVYCHPKMFLDILSVMDDAQAGRVVTAVMEAMRGRDLRTEYYKPIPVEDWKYICMLLRIMEDEPKEKPMSVARRRRCK